MNFSNLWKGLAVVAVLFLFSLEASAQLPVRTQTVEWINPVGGTVRFNADGDPDVPLAGAPAVAATSYTVTWPNAPHTGAAANDQSILLGTWTGGTDVNLEWFEIDGFVDGTGALNHVTYWDPDDQTLHYSPNFEWDGTTLGVGMNGEAADPDGLGPATAGNIMIGDGTNAQVQLNVVPGEGTFGNATTAGSVIVTNAGGVTVGDIDGATATATVGAAAGGAAGTVNVASATAAVNGVALNGAAGTGTFGNTGITGELVIHNGEPVATANSVTLQTGLQTEDQVVQFDIPTTAGVAGTRWLPISTNQSLVQYQILISNGDGTATWSQNPAGQIQAGAETPAANSYSGTVTFATPFIDPDGAGPLTNTPTVVITPNGNDAYIIQITNVTNTTFDWASTAPFDGTDQILWMANARTE